MFKSTILKRLAFNTDDNYNNSLKIILNSLRHATFNSYNSLRLLFSGDDYVRDWNNQIDDVSLLIKEVKLLKFHFVRNKSRKLLNFEHIEKSKFMKTLFYKRVVNEYLVSLSDTSMTPEGLGINKGKYNFINISIWNTLSSEINIFNVLLFIKIPAITAYIGNTRIFNKLMHISNLAPALKKLEKFGKWGPRISLLIVHTLDGQEVYAAYKIYSGLQSKGWDGFDFNYRPLTMARTDHVLLIVFCVKRKLY